MQNENCRHGKMETIYADNAGSMKGAGYGNRIKKTDKRISEDEGGG